VRITTEQLPQHLKRGLTPLYVVYGDETLLALEAADRIRATARAQGYGERDLLIVEAGFKWSELALAGQSQSLFASRKLLELRIPSGKPGVEGSQALAEFARALPADVLTLISLPGLDWRAQKAAWFEALAAAGVLVEAQTVSRKALPGWLAGRLKLQDQSADAETLEFLADRVEGNLLAAYQEVQKLALLCPPGAVSLDQVRDAVVDVARFDVFDLPETLLEGDPLRIARTIEGLKGEGAAPPLVLWQLTEEIRGLAKTLAGVRDGKPPQLAMREARVFGAPHQALMQRHLDRFRLPQVYAALRHAAAVDRAVKGLARADVWDELLQLALRLARGARAKAPGKTATMAAGGSARL
jgi:DNA polymerase-3 subunit delta